MTIIAKITFDEFLRRISKAPQDNVAKWWHDTYMPMCVADSALLHAEEGTVLTQILREYVQPETVPTNFMVAYDLFDHQLIVASRLLKDSYAEQPAAQKTELVKRTPHRTVAANVRA